MNCKELCELMIFPYSYGKDLRTTVLEVICFGQMLSFSRPQRIHWGRRRLFWFISCRLAESTEDNWHFGPLFGQRWSEVPRMSVCAIAYFSDFPTFSNLLPYRGLGLQLLQSTREASCGLTQLKRSCWQEQDKHLVLQAWNSQECKQLWLKPKRSSEQRIWRVIAIGQLRLNTFSII